MASTAQISELDAASNACLELCSHHGFATGHGDTVADIIREIDAQITEMLAAKPADEGCQKALRRLAIVQRHRMAYGGGTVHVGWVCKTCDSDWDRDAAEKHKADCPAALSTTIAPKLDPPDNSLTDPSTMGEVE